MEGLVAEYTAQLSRQHYQNEELNRYMDVVYLLVRKLGGSASISKDELMSLERKDLQPLVMREDQETGCIVLSVDGHAR